MNCDVVLLPGALKASDLTDRCAAVFDVLRATTTMTAALAAGAGQIRVFATLDEARAAAGKDGSGARPLLCGEERCVKPAGFDLGNSPDQFLPVHRGADLFFCTTNGTRALLAARGAAEVLVGALVNASAVAGRIAESGRDATMVCAGTGGAVAMEDVLGGGAVIEALMLRTEVKCESDTARMALELFRACRARLKETLRGTRGGMNVIQAGLWKDIEFAASVDALQTVGIAAGEPLVVRGA